MALDLLRLEAALAAALTSPDPARALRALSEDAELAAEDRARLAAVDSDGFVLAALLVVRLRFERAMNGSKLAAEWFTEDPAGFAAAFRDYCGEVPAHAGFPSAEGRAFEAWAASRD